MKKGYSTVQGKNSNLEKGHFQWMRTCIWTGKIGLEAWIAKLSLNKRMPFKWRCT